MLSTAGFFLRVLRGGNTQTGSWYREPENRESQITL
jgi:hypothetical protein